MERRGFATLLINVGCQGTRVVPVDVEASTVAEASGEDWRAIFARQDRGECVALMTRAARLLGAPAR